MDASQSVRYRTRDVALLKRNSATLAISREAANWATVNENAALLLNLCRDNDGLPPTLIHRRYCEAYGSVPYKDISESIQKLEKVGLLAKVAPNGGLDSDGDRSCFQIEHVYLELLARCNLRCLHCFMEGAPNRAESLSLEEVFTILDDSASSHVRHVTLSGGEPLLYPDLPQVVARTHRLGFTGTLISNGTLLRERHLKMLGDANFSLGISLDGVDISINDRIRGVGSGLKIHHAIDLALRVLGPERITLSFTPVGLNADQIPQLIEFALLKGIKRVSFSIYEKAGRALSFQDILHLTTADRSNIVRHIYAAAVHNARNLQIDLNDTRNVLAKFGSRNICSEIHPILKSVRVDSSGDVYPSSFGCSPEHRVGSIRSQSFESLICSQQLQDLAESLFERFRKIEKCSQCAWQQICRGGSVSNAYYATGDVFTPDPFCDAYQDVFPDILIKLSDMLGSSP